MPVKRRIKRTVLRKAKAHAYLGKRKAKKYGRKARATAGRVGESGAGKAAAIVGASAALGAGTSAAIAPKGRRKKAAKYGAVAGSVFGVPGGVATCLLYTSPSPRD